MIERNDLHAIADGLRGNAKLRVFANHNDFLTSDDDLSWLSATVGSERVRVFPRGGHLGNLHDAGVQADVLRALTDVSPMDSIRRPSVEWNAPIGEK